MYMENQDTAIPTNEADPVIINIAKDVCSCPEQMCEYHIFKKTGLALP